MAIKFGVGENCLSQESKYNISKNSIKKFDYLIFMDSRGLVVNNGGDNSYIDFVKNRFEYKELNYIIVSRPKNLTTLATLYNFLKLNEDLYFTNLITNLGFVDCTPKKEENINDMLLQISQFSKTENKIIEFEEFELSEGKTEILKSIDYSLEFKRELSHYLNHRFEKLYFINTPIVSQDIQIERKRPKSFFDQLKNTNSLIDELIKFDLTKNRLIDIGEVANTYDAVHYTKEGHQKIYEKIVKELNI